MTLEDRSAELEAENAALREQVRQVPLLHEQIAWLTVQVRDLQAWLANDSHNIGLGEGISAGTYKGF